MEERIGVRFQQATKYAREGLVGRRLDWDSKPGTYKEYRGSERVPLAHPVPYDTLTLDEALRHRRSVRDFSPTPLTREQLSYLLWASTGIRECYEGYAFRTAPSAGALYPIETYVVVNNVQDVPSGLYHYNIQDHVLEELKEGDLSEEIALGALDQEMCMHAPVVLVWTAVFQRSKWKYEQRAYRYVYLDTGHIAANLALASTSIGLGSCQIGAFFDDEVNRLLGVDGVEESVLYLSVVGRPADRE
jgi:SagB-type dehydrogenase family enzyme